MAENIDAFYIQQARSTTSSKNKTTRVHLFRATFYNGHWVPQVSIYNLACRKFFDDINNKNTDEL